MTNENKSTAVDVAHDTMLGDLMKVLVHEVKAMPKPWQQMPEANQKRVIESFESACTVAIRKAVTIIAGKQLPMVECELESVTVKDGIKAVLTVSKTNGNRHALVDATGSAVAVVIASAGEYLKGALDVKPDPQQPGLDLEGGGDPAAEARAALVDTQALVEDFLAQDVTLEQVQAGLQSKGFLVTLAHLEALSALGLTAAKGWLAGHQGWQVPDELLALKTGGLSVVVQLFDELERVAPLALPKWKQLGAVEAIEAFTLDERVEVLQWARAVLSAEAGNDTAVPNLPECLLQYTVLEDDADDGAGETQG